MVIETLGFIWAWSGFGICQHSTFLCGSGFVIPRGWRIYVYTREINYDPFLYPEPYTFNPWRWLVSHHAMKLTATHS